MTHPARESKGPEVRLLFWIAKIAATTLGETGGDAVSMSLDMGYALSSAIFFALFLVTALAQIAARRFHPVLYWAVIVATTTAGTTMADLADRSLGLGYAGGTLLLLGVTATIFALWRRAAGRVEFGRIDSPKIEAFYWVTVLASSTLGTALGDYFVDATPLGYEGSALVFGCAILGVIGLHLFSRLSPALLFWAAFVLTRPLGATLGDMLTKPLAQGGLELSRFASTAVIALLMLGCILLGRRRRGA